MILKAIVVVLIARYVFSVYVERSFTHSKYVENCALKHSSYHLQVQVHGLRNESRIQRPKMLAQKS